MPIIRDSIGLFAGVGGFELGMAPNGYQPTMFCEIDAAAQNVLRTWKPATVLHHDVRELSDLSPAVLLAAGFPCQDLSPAGKKQGITGAKSSLIQHVFRLLQTRRIPWIVIENIPFMLQLRDGTGIRTVTESLERLGYRWAYRVVDAMNFGLPQRRQRLFIVATTEGDPREVLFGDDAGPATAPKSQHIDISEHCVGFYWTEGSKGVGIALNAVPPLKAGSTINIPSAPAILFPDGRLGTPDIRDAERLQGLPENWTLPGCPGGPQARWRLTGNAVPIPIAHWIGHRIANPHPYTGNSDKPMLSNDRFPRAAYNMGNGAFAVQVSENPLSIAHPRIDKFLRYPVKPLSARATRGFLSRARQSTLRCFPEGFLARLDNHLEYMTYSQA